MTETTCPAYPLAGADATGLVQIEQQRRLFRAEKQQGLDRLLEAVLQIRDLASNGSLATGMTAEDWLLMANVLVDCPLPFRPTKERVVSRRTRFHDEFVSVRFTAMREGVDLPTATDSRLLHWLLNRLAQKAREARALNEPPSRVIVWSSGYEYLADVGMTICAKNYRDLRQSFARISGLAITIERKGARDRGRIIPFLEAWDLPSSLDSTSDSRTDGRRGHYTVELSEAIVRSVADHFVAIPRDIWKLTARRPLQGSLFIWMYKRAYTAGGRSLVSWDLIREQFGLQDSNSQRIKRTAREMAALLTAMWPGCGVCVRPRGIEFGGQSSPFFQRSLGVGGTAGSRLFDFKDDDRLPQSTAET